MKKLLNTTIAICCLLTFQQTLAQEDEKPEPSISVRYFNQNGSLQYLRVKVMIKEDNKLQPVPGVPIQLYLDERLGIPDCQSGHK